MFPKTSNNVRFPTKTSQLSTTKRDEDTAAQCRLCSMRVTMLCEHRKHSKVVLPNVIFGQISTTNYDLSIHKRSTSKIAHPQMILGEIETVQCHWSLSAKLGRISHPFNERSVWSLRPIRSGINDNAFQKVMASHSNPENLGPLTSDILAIEEVDAVLLWQVTESLNNTCVERSWNLQWHHHWWQKNSEFRHIVPHPPGSRGF